MKLIVAEKPSVGFAIAKALNINGMKNGYIENSEYIVTWCVGHLVSMAYPQDYNKNYAKWRYLDLPIIPSQFQYKIYGDKQKQFNTVKLLMNRKDVKELINACDAGREGELIFRLVYNKAGCKKPVKRLWISSMEDKAICDGFNSLKDSSQYDNLYQSALCRMWADWLVGINATRLFSILYNKTLNIGRVQTPTLALLCEREDKITHFQKQKYFTVTLDLSGAKVETEPIQSEKTAKEVQTACEKSQAVCTFINTERKTEQPPKLFDLTALQRAANKVYGYTAKQTLDYAQSLYEKKLITYPRTESRYLTRIMEQTITAIIDLSKKISPFDKMADFCPETKRMINDSKVSEHHAIIPTMEINNTDLSVIPQGEFNILQLIICRTLVSSAEPYIYEITKANFECGGYVFSAKNKNIVSYGFMAIEKLLAVSSENDDENKITQNFYEGSSFDIVNADISEHYTAPPKAYTEDTLLSAMEKAGAKETNDNTEHKGLGTPATRASIIEKLVHIGFVERKGRKLVPTKDGILLISVLPDTLISADMTAQWENTLSRIANGQERPQNFMNGINHLITELVKQFRGYDKDIVNPFQRNQ